MEDKIYPVFFSPNGIREYTEAEIREIFLRSVWDRIRYWDDDRFSRNKALSGLAFSILSMIDGCSLDIPPYKISPIMDHDGYNFDIENGNNLYPITEEIDIGGSLHELFYTFKDEENYTIGEYDRFRNVSFQKPNNKVYD